MAVQEIQEFGRFHLSSFYLVFKSCAVHAPCSCEMWKTCSTYNRPAYAAVNKTRFTPHNLRTLLCPCRWIWIYGVELPIHGTSSSLDSAPKPPVTLYSSLFGEKCFTLSCLHCMWRMYACAPVGRKEKWELFPLLPRWELFPLPRCGQRWHLNETGGHNICAGSSGPGQDGENRRSHP